MTTETDQDTTQSLLLSRAEFDALLRRLNLANTRRTYQAFARRAEQESWSYCDFLGRLLMEEVAKRKQTRLQRCTRSAHFPFFKTIEEFDFTQQSKLENRSWVPTWGQTSSPKGAR
jgi:DNA replication protein DnaC